ncbi:MAG: hypothetical protein A2636_05765 [Elusimicrobia bacterium RIFCSPHIGHO2_01_FULL_64_10]|nr:MAG: hypothetical protein A2636_05765 [Elusimicrobia bacterium RIFCSPHIGHO2_01_FULL_64_10]
MKAPIRSALAAFALAWVSGFPAPRAAAADLYLQIQRGEKVMIALPGFVSKGPDEEQAALAKELHSVAKDDLLFSRLFNLIEEGPPVGEGKIDFPGWGERGADLLAMANVKIDRPFSGKKEDSVRMIGSVFEAPGGNPVFQKTYTISKKNARKLPHEFVADILYRFTGNRGSSASRIAFVNDSTGSKELYLIDYDGANLRRVTRDGSIALLPRWSPDGKEIAYTTYRRGNPDLAVFSLENGTSRILSSRQGLNAAASYSPDGQSLVLTLSFQGAPSLYLIDRAGKILRRLTRSRSAETSPSFSADGRRIVYVSDRPGWPQIYVMDSDGSNSPRLTFSGYCDAPVWSPLGDKLAYSRGTRKGGHNIIVRDLASGAELQLTSGAGSNENPSFSPDGRFLVFTTTRGGKRELYLTNLDGTVQRVLADIPGNCYTPSWSP